MLRAGALRRWTVGLVLSAVAAVGLGGCVLAPFPEPVIGGPVVVAPSPVIVAPRPYYRGGYYHGGYYHGGYHRRWH
jgi:hypothetical protein